MRTERSHSESVTLSYMESEHIEMMCCESTRRYAGEWEGAEGALSGMEGTTRWDKIGRQIVLKFVAARDGRGVVE